MKVDFTANHLAELGIKIAPVDFEILPLIGDFVRLQDYMNADQSELFQEHMRSIGKIHLGTVGGRMWNKVNDQNVVTLYFEFEDILDQE